MNNDTIQEKEIYRDIKERAFKEVDYYSKEYGGKKITQDDIDLIVYNQVESIVYYSEMVRIASTVDDGRFTYYLTEFESECGSKNLYTMSREVINYALSDDIYEYCAEKDIEIVDTLEEVKNE